MLNAEDECIQLLSCSPPGSSFSRQEYWSGLLFPSPGDPVIKLTSLASPVLAGKFFTTKTPGRPLDDF